MKHLDNVLEMVDNELKSVSENGKFRSREEVDTVYKLVDIAKDVYCIWEYEDSEEDGYSENYSRAGYPYRYGMVYGDDGHSYARGRRNAKRDSMGRYSRDDEMHYRDRGYSRNDGNREYIENLRSMMHNAPDENTRNTIQRMIDQMEQG